METKERHVKKYLLGTTAVAVATGFAALTVSTPADAAERLKLGVAGYFQAYYAFVDQRLKSTSPAKCRSTTA